MRKRPLKFIPLRILDLVVFLSLLGCFGIWAMWMVHSTPPTFTSDQITQMSQDQRQIETLKLLVSRKLVDYAMTPVLPLAIALLMIVIEYRPLAKLVLYLTESAFYWGDAVPHFDRRDRLGNNIKWGIIIAFIISVIAGLATTCLQSFWTKH